MKGMYEVSVRNKQKVSFKFTLRRKITVVAGDSGTGKTTLFDMIALHMRGNVGNAVTITCKRPCIALTDYDWQHQLSETSDSIVFVDEGAKYISSEDFARAVVNSSNYFVLFTRIPLYQLPYSVDEVYRITTSGRIHRFVPMYPSKGNHAYGVSIANSKAAHTVVLVEDSKSGLQFFESRFHDSEIVCTTSYGKAGIYRWLQEHRGQKVFVVADGAAFGPDAKRVFELQQQHPEDIYLCLPESFEWLLLNAGLLHDDSLADILKNPAAYIDSSDYTSWEQFFTNLLQSSTLGTPLEYHKDSLNESWLLPSNADRVMAQIAHANIK